MLIDVRTYKVRPNMMKDHLELYDRFGREPQCRHLGLPLAMMTTETGNVNEYVHIWVYDNAADREARRAAMWSDPEWLDYVARVKEMDALVDQNTRLMNPVGFMEFRKGL